MRGMIVIGASGFGREVVQYIRDAYSADPDVSIKGFLDDNLQLREVVVEDTGLPLLGDTHTYGIEESDRFIISLGDPGLRRSLANRLARRGAQFATIVHPRAYVAETARLGIGCVVAPFAYVGAHALVGEHALLNLHSAVGHDTRIAACCVLSPHALVNGGAALGDCVFLGSHATVTPGIRVGQHSKVAAGAVVYRAVPERSLATGNPARAVPLEQSGSSTI